MPGHRSQSTLATPHTYRPPPGPPQYYADFSQTSDAEVLSLLAAHRGGGRAHSWWPFGRRSESGGGVAGGGADSGGGAAAGGYDQRAQAAAADTGHPLRQPAAAPAGDAQSPPIVREVLLNVPQRPGGAAADAVQLPGTLTWPEGARGAVLFAHGSGSSRASPRNRLVAGALHDVRRAGVGVLACIGPSVSRHRVCVAALFTAHTPTPTRLAWPHCCSTCSRRARRLTAPTCST